MFGDKPKPSLAGVYSDKAIPMVAWLDCIFISKTHPLFLAVKRQKILLRYFGAIKQKYLRGLRRNTSEGKVSVER